MSNPILILNQQQVFNGLGTLTYTVPSDGAYSAAMMVTVPQALPTGDGGGSGQGLGSGSGGGGTGFVLGGQGLGEGGVGQGFGPGSGYPQPPAYGSNATLGSAVSSSLSVLVKQNGSTIYTMPALAASQSAAGFNYAFLATANDVITIVISSAAASDNALNGVSSQVAINQGL